MPVPVRSAQSSSSALSLTGVSLCVCVCVAAEEEGAACSKTECAETLEEKDEMSIFATQAEM